MADYSQMRRMAALSPEEEAASAAYETSPATRMQLEEAMRAESDPAKRAVLGQLYAQDFQGAAPSGAAAPRLSMSEFLAGQTAPNPGGPAAVPGSRVSMLDFLANVQVPPAPPPPSGMIRRVAGDGGLSLLKGAIGVPEAIVGLADIATGGRAGKMAEEAGFRPKEAKGMLDEFMTPEQKQANENVQKAQGVVDTTVAAFQNPSVVLHSIAESLPSMLGGGVVGRAVMKMAPAVTRAVAAGVGVGEGAVAAGVGEGVVSAGQSAEQIRQETTDGLLTPQQAALAGGSGVLTGLLGVVAGKVAGRMGVHDVDILATGKGEPVVQKSFTKQVLLGALSEGILEELPQSVQEQVAQNLALGKPIDEGVAQAAVLGALAGGVMGAGAQALGGHQKTAGDEVRDTKVPEAGPLTRAANAGIEVEAKALDATAGRALPKEPLAPDAAKALLDMANERAAELETKAKGTKDEKKGGKTIAGTPAQFLTPEEKAELEFLKEHGGDVAQLEARYGKPMTLAGETTPSDALPFEANRRFEGAPVFPNGKAPAAQTYGTKQAADIAIGEQGLMGSHQAVETAPNTFQIRPIGTQASVVQPGIYETTEASSAVVPPMQRPQPAAAAAPAAQPPVAAPAPARAVASGKDASAAPNTYAAHGMRLSPEEAIGFMESQAARDAADAKASGYIAAKRAKNAAKLLATAPVQASEPPPGETPVPSVVRGGDAGPFKSRKVAERRAAKIQGATVEQTDVGFVLRVPLTAKAAAAETRAEMPKAGATLDTLTGDKINRKWTAFAPDSGTLNVPRAEMPQIKAEHRGAMVNFLNARGISHETDAEIPAANLKPTQTEFSPGKVAQAKAYEGGDRSILVSSDNYVLDGHHQWLAKLESGEPVKAIRLNAPMRDLLPVVREFPSAETAKGAPIQPSTVESTTANEQTEPAATPVETTPAQAAPTGVAAPAGTGEAPARPAVAGPAAVQANGLNSASWVIREKATGKVIAETFDSKKVDALNTSKYEAVPIRDYLVGLNKAAAEVAAAPTPSAYEVVATPEDKGPRARIAKKRAEKAAARSNPDAKVAKDVAPATHAELGAKPEPVTPPVVVESLSKAAKIEGRKPSEMKADLLAQIDKARTTLPPGIEGDVRDVYLAKQRKVIAESSRKSQAIAAQVSMDAAVADYGHTTFDVPGDGKFKVLNTPDSFADFRRKVESSRGFEDKPYSGPRVQRAPASAGTADAVSNMIGDGDFQAAVAYAEAKGVNLNDIKLSKTDRAKFDQWTNDHKPNGPDKVMFQRKSTEPFYSELAKQIGAAKMAAAPAQGWADLIKGLTQKGVKPDEVQWSGINEWLALQGAKVTKQQVLDFLAGNGVKVEESVLENKDTEIAALREKAIAAFEARGYGLEFNGDEVMYIDKEDDPIEYDDLPKALRKVIDEISAKEDSSNAGGTKYEQYVLPGGTNYRELLLTLPETFGAKANADGYTPLSAVSEAQYKSHHWNDVNVLTHIRFNERTDADGKRVLFIEEIQSDWAQQGKKHGFKGTGELPSVNRDRAYQAARDALMRNDDLGFESHIDALRDIHQHHDWRERWDVPDADAALIASYIALPPLANVPLQVPAAPFVGKTYAWVALAIKRATKWAVDNGFDRVAFVNGEQSAERYDLSKQVQSIDVERYDLPNVGPVADVRVIGLDGKQVHSVDGASMNSLADLVGKELADRIAAQAPETRKEYSGDGLKVGGEGMRTFYDSIVPKVAKEVVRKLGGDGLVQVELDSFDNSTGRKHLFHTLSQTGFDITDKMIAAAEGGVPLFQRSEGKIAGMRRRLTQEVADAISSQWENAPPIVVIGSMAEAPGSALRENEAQLAQGADGSPAAFIVGGKVYLVASQMKTTKDVATALFHEVLGHHGLRGAFGDSLNDVLKIVADGQPEALAAKAAEYGLDLADEEQRLTAAEELLAELAQTKPKASIVQRAIAAIRTWLREHVPMFKNLALSDAEIIRNFITPARRFVETGRAVVKESLTTADGTKFQRVGAALMEATDRARAVQLPAGYLVGDLFNSAGKVNWWHKTLGTPFNLAKRSPLFKRVYDAVQNFLNDVSYYAIESANLAPRILPKLDSWKDIGKSPLTAAETKAIAAPIFEGTLLWTRDAAGKPVKVADLETQAAAMTIHDKAHKLYTTGKLTEGEFKRWRNLPISAYEGAIENRYEREFLRGGVVWSDSELKSMFGMTEGDKGTIGLYREFRKAIDHSLTNLAISDMLHFGGADVASLRAQALATRSVDEAAVMLRDHLFKLAAEDAERASVLNDTANKMIDKADRAKDLMAKGYAPLSRFGTYSLDVVGADGTREYFGLFETTKERSRMARQMRGMFPGAKVTEGTTSQEAYKLFAGVSPETLELFGGMLGLEAQGNDAASQAFQTYLKLAKSTRSAMKRLIERKGIAGFSEDAGRVLAGFVYSNARQTSSNLHMSEMTQGVRDIPQGHGELQDQASKLVEYVKKPQEGAHRIKALLFVQYLGGSIAAALVNMTQPIAVTFPYLSQYGGVNKARKQMTAAIADAMKKTTGDKALDEALKKAEEEGIVSPQEVHQLLAQSMGRGTLKSGDGTVAGDAAAKASNFLSKLSLGWGKVFGIAEQANRRITFIAAYRTAVDQGMPNPAEFAANAVNETQFTYNQGNRPMAARGAAGSVLMTFKQYSISYLELVNRMWTQGGPEGKKAALLAMAMLFLMGGADGLPFADDADDVIDGAMQHLGYNFSSKQAKREFFANLLGRDGAQFVSKGLSGLPGVPIDVSGRLGMGNVIPGTGMLTKKTDHTSDVAELAGPLGDFGKRVVQATGQAFTGDVGGAVTTIAPKAMQNLVKGYDMANSGMYKDEKGRKVIDVDGFDALSKAIGFQPNDVARTQEAARTAQQFIALNKMRETEIADKWAQGMFEHDPAKVQEARDDLKSWNERNPESRIVINSAQIRRRVQQMGMSKAERLAKTAPKEIRATVKAELESSR